MNRKFYEKTIDVREIFKGKIIQVNVETVQLPNGKTATREIVRHPGAVAILPLMDGNRKAIMVEQFRKPLDRSILEIPAGKLEAGEDPRQCAIRELKEETGYSTDHLEHLVSFYTSPGFADEIMHLYVAQNCVPGNNDLDDDEFIDLKILTLEEAYRLIQTGEIIDAKTIMAVYYWDILTREERRK